MGDYIGLIIFIVFIVARLMGQKKQDNRPKRGQPAPRPNPAEATGSPSSDERRSQKEREWSPIPDDIRDLFDFPGTEEEKPEPIKNRDQKSSEKHKQEKNWDREIHVPQAPEGSIVHSEEIGSHDLAQQVRKKAKPYRHKSRSRRATNLGGLELNPSAVMQGIIWSEVLQQPKSRRQHYSQGRR